MISISHLGFLFGHIRAAFARRGVLFFLLCILISCSEKNKVDTVSTAKDAMKAYRLIQNDRSSQKKIYAGDPATYSRLKEIYFNSGNKKEFFYEAFVMSNIYNFPEADYDIYFILHSDEITDKNRHINQIANYYLLRAFERKVVNKKEVWERIGSNYTELPKSEDYLCNIKN